MKGLLTGLVVLLWASMAMAAAHSPINFTNGSTPCLGGTLNWSPAVMSGGQNKLNNVSIGFIDPDATAAEVIGYSVDSITTNDTDCGNQTCDPQFPDCDMIYDPGLIITADEGPTQAWNSILLRNESCTTHPRSYFLNITCYDGDTSPFTQQVTVIIQTTR